MKLSIVIPTFNERDNVCLITQRIRSIMQTQMQPYEIIFVDDSRDDTPIVLEQLSREFSTVKYIHREHEKGLASAVVQGFQFSQGQQIIVMDADLQHSPELIPLILKRLATADVVIPSRFISGGSDGGLNEFRKLVSWTARTIGRLSIKRLRRVSDCTGGYFGINRTVIEGVQLNPIGWKILMEVLVKGNYQTVHEIPYSFIARDAGKSKMSLQEQWNFLRHIGRLVWNSPEDRRFMGFCAIGSLGVVVNLIVLRLLLSFWHMDESMASVAASLLAMLHNFLWNDHLIWKGHQQPVLWKRVLQFPQFMLVCGLGIAITTLCARFFWSLGWSIYAGQLIGIATSLFWNFAANDRWTWSAKNGKASPDNSNLVITQEYGGKIS
ncbi:MAG TPA: glycosyltransferase family 2 protein [Negativicutes bacterium]